MTERQRSNLLPSAFVACSLLLAGCGDTAPDAYGNFEATEVVVSAEIGGILLWLEAEEGDRIPIGALVGQVDTTRLVLQREEIVSQQQASQTRTTEAEAQIEVLRVQLATAREEYDRTLRLYEADAATARQLNQAGGEVRTLLARIDAARAQAEAASEEAGSVGARVAQADEQIEKSRITNPVGGTVLTTYVEPGEFVQPGMPLYEIANLDTLTLRAYISGAQLASVQVGERVEVRFDRGDDLLETVQGRVTWVASDAEFTPTPIQTRDERTDQVYAIKVRVPNSNGAIKIGMPGEVYFSEKAAPDL